MVAIDEQFTNPTGAGALEHDVGYEIGVKVAHPHHAIPRGVVGAVRARGYGPIRIERFQGENVSIATPNQVRLRLGDTPQKAHSADKEGNS